MEIHKDWEADKLFMSEKNYIENLLEHFGMQRSKPVSTPSAIHFKLLMALSPESDEESTCIMFLII